MKPTNADADRHAGAEPARAPRRAAAAACLCFGLLPFGAGGAALAQRSEAPPPRSSEVAPGQYRQQPSPERARDLMRQEGVLPSPEERREELRALNQIYRELMPPGPGTVPAPGVAPEAGPRRER